MEDQIQLSHQQQRALRAYLDWFERARSNRAVEAALGEYYDEEQFYTVTAAGETVSLPVMTREHWLGLDGSLNEFVGSISHERTTNHHEQTIRGVAEEMYVRRRGMNQRGEPAFFDVGDILWNGGTYRIRGLTDGSNASFDLGVSDFYSYVSHHERLLRHLHTRLQSEGAETPSDARQVVRGYDLPLRDDVAGDLDAILNWSDHFHKVGPVCLLAVERLGEPPVVYTVERTRDVLHEPETHSVAPAGELTPDAHTAADLQQSVIRELVEELLGVSKSRHSDASSTNELEQRIWSHVVAGQIEVERTAVGFTVDAPRPVLAGLVYVRDPSVGDWIRDELRTNWEIKRLNRVELPLDRLPTEMTGPKASRPGAFAFIEGLRRLEDRGVDTGLDIRVE